MKMEWLDEKDFYEFEYLGYKCEIKRNALGNLCGYIYVTNRNVLNNTYDLDVHGGITYETNNKIGFDCGHYGDFSPYGSNYSESEYRNVEYVTNELKSLAEQCYSYENLSFKVKSYIKEFISNCKLKIEALFIK